MAGIGLILLMGLCLLFPAGIALGALGMYLYMRRRHPGSNTAFPVEVKDKTPPGTP